MSSHHSASKPNVRTETIKSGIFSTYKFGNHDLKVLNDCTVELDLVTLDKLFGDHFSIESTDSHEEKWIYWQITEGRVINGKTNFSLSRYHPTCKKMPYHTLSNKRIWITNYTAGQQYKTVRDLIKSTSAIEAFAQNESHWKLDWNKEEGRLALEKMSNGKSKGREHSRSRSSYKRLESETGNESSKSTSGNEALGIGETRSHRSMPSPLPGYTHSLVESQNSEMAWSGRPEPIDLSLSIGIHRKDRNVRYYGYMLTNSTRFALWWDEIADILLSKGIIKPPSAKGSKGQGKLIEEGNRIMIQFDTGSVKSKVGEKKYSVSYISNLCDAIQGTPNDSCTHERYRVKTYSLLEYKHGIAADEQYPSISIRNRLRYEVACKDILRGLGKLIGETDGEGILAKNKGEIWKLIQKSDGAYLSKSNSTQLPITIHSHAKHQSDTSSSVYYSFSEESQGTRRLKSHSAHKSPPSVSSRDGSNQDRAPPQMKLEPFRARSVAFAAPEGHIKNNPDCNKSREPHRAATSGSRFGVESDAVEQNISFYHPPTSSHGNSGSSIHPHAQTQTEEPKERERKSSKFRVPKFFKNKQDSSDGQEYSSRQERTRDRHMRREVRREERRQKRREKKLAEKERKDKEREEERKWREEIKQMRNRRGPSEWGWNDGREERPRKSSTRGKLTFTFSIEGKGRRRRGSDV
ncbi:uncharacterized protein EAE97_000167 [Botrytis byssoidea]|uniref:Uncharacterized protein n=1 Tax=Botrytis byssoidea TaxID=139641 RepID=A0A9P5IZY1_9HELO|nr:uncharacterized protein EAE97_000167 [Botrytis byssoidea]KAF7954908.1 hypothetical protein EAE97_000167 [Botrytis byssoidea]